jgi:dephospho-CoA kinase
MIKIGILGDIGSGKSFIARQFGCPVFNADKEVNKIYKKNRYCYKKLRDKLPKYIKSYPINKIELSKAIIANNKNLRKVVNIVHPIVRKEMNLFLKRNNKRKMVVLDIPLLIENKLNKKKDILIFIDAKKKGINSRLKKRINYNKKLIDNFRKIQKPLVFKKKLSTYIIKNNFKLLTIKKRVKLIKADIINERNST